MQTTFWDSPSSRRMVPLALLAIFMAFSIHYAFTKAIEGRSAVLRWQPQVLGLDSNENIAELYAYPNPPIMALLLYPLMQLPPMVAAMTWFYLKMILALVAIHWTFRLVAGDRPFPFVAQLVTALVVLRPILGDLEHGNVNLLILFLIVGCLVAYRAGWPILSGLVLGLAIGCKITPALFVPYFVYKRAGKVLAGTVLGVALFLYPGWIPAALMGAQDNHDHLVGWYNVMVKPFVVEGKVTSEQQNQSLPGLIVRLFTHSPSATSWDGKQYVPLSYHNVADLSLDTAKLLVKGAMLLFVILVVVACRTRPDQGADWRLAAEFAIVSLGMLLFSERTWKHHAVPLLLPFAVLAWYMVAGSVVRLRWVSGITLAVSALLIALTSNGLVTKSLAKLSQVYGAYTIVFVLLCGVLGLLLLATPKEAIPTEPEALARGA